MGRIEKAKVCQAHVDHHENIGVFHYHQLKFCINPKSVRHTVRCFEADDAYAHLPKDVWGFKFAGAAIVAADAHWWQVKNSV